jgi:hypothetical protein
MTQAFYNILHVYAPITTNCFVGFGPNESTLKQESTPYTHFGQGYIFSFLPLIFVKL